MGWVPWPFRRRESEEEDEVFESADFQPVLLIPGIGGSILNAISDNGVSERIWVRLLMADHEFRSKLWSKYDPETGKTVSLDKTSRIEVPEDNFGLYSCDVLDPGLGISVDAINYYHCMIIQMHKWGFKDGVDLFGFGYDFRQSNRLPETMRRLRDKLRMIFEKTGKKVDVITHSMGGLLFKSFLALHHDDVAAYVNKWVAIAAPFRGAPGFITDTILTGVEFLKGWQKSLFIAKWSMHQLLVECPSVYELMADYSFDWGEVPELRIVKQKQTNGGEVEVEEQRLKREKDVLSMMQQVLQDNKVNLNGETIPLPLNDAILECAQQTREIWKSATLPDSVEHFVIYGTSLDTPYHSRYGSQKAPLKDPRDVLHTEVEFECVDGDGTVPCQSALGGGLPSKFHIGVPGEHRALLNDPRVYRLLQFFLHIGGPDNLYDPYTDCVLVPSREEVERSMVLSKLEEAGQAVRMIVGEIDGEDQPLVNVKVTIKTKKTVEVEEVELSLSTMAETLDEDTLKLLAKV